jgi:two-component system chemotaxis sensor kinase CheA
VLNAIFRAAHSIKGGSGTFGFTQLTEATHEMETLFDACARAKGRPTRPPCGCCSTPATSSRRTSRA